MAVGGLADSDTDHAVSIVGLGVAMLEEAARHEALGKPLQLRIGVHTGPVVGGVIGTRKLAFDMWGDTVNVASRLEGLSPPGRILVSEATWQLVRGHFQCEVMADSELRGHSTMRTYSIVGPLQRAAEEGRALTMEEAVAQAIGDQPMSEGGS